MAAKTIAIRPSIFPGLSLAGLGAAALAMLRMPVATYYGAICGHAPVAAHCPACYAAAAMIVAGLAAAVAASRA